MAQVESTKNSTNDSIIGLPVNVSDRKTLIETDKPKINRNVGWYTWIIAAICLPLVGISVLSTVILFADSSNAPRADYHRAKRNKIFIIDINNNRPSKNELNSIEACLNFNQKSELYLLNLSENGERPKNVTFLDRLKRKYQNFHFLYQTFDTFFEGSIFYENLNKEDDPNKILFKAQLLTLWRYGGVILSPDWAPLKPFDQTHITKDGILSVGLYNGRVGFLASPDSCNAKVFDIMRELKNIKGTSKSLECDVIDRVILNSKKGLNKVGFPLMCNNNTRSDVCMLMKVSQEDAYPEALTNHMPVEPVPEPYYYRFVPFFRRFYYYN